MQILLMPEVARFQTASTSLLVSLSFFMLASKAALVSGSLLRRLPLSTMEARSSLFQLVALPKATTVGTKASLEPIWMEMTSACLM